MRTPDIPEATREGRFFFRADSTMVDAVQEYAKAHGVKTSDVLRGAVAGLLTEEGFSRYVETINDEA